ncbi:helix-turn-helix domain-containing protein [Cellvibrio japonicus]|nr:helix-turn-helix transcriptional regulator [Cellvibrio japonicus]QEI13931.1 helix-turn-helix transcriptional regulator [Cellvibrio japonicus]QEI17505.1 helix-turn-helix transcriptional regulator [Cellvibrio japonicus]QEI21081.1 helix-turn-helix transcriptional regulator [Cellvibrio japonicus]
MDLLALHTPSDVQLALAAFVRARRKALKWSRDELAARSTVPAPTIKRFELTGEISLRQLLLLWQCLDDLGRLAALCERPNVPVPRTIEEVLQS